MTELSPVAQAVLDAFENASDGEYVEGVWVVNERTMLAAALCAAADQVVPSVPLNLNARGTRHWHRAIRDNEIRLTITAIATELEARSND
jgi:hypothetical protein